MLCREEHCDIFRRLLLLLLLFVLSLVPWRFFEGRRTSSSTDLSQPVQRPRQFSLRLSPAVQILLVCQGLGRLKLRTKNVHSFDHSLSLVRPVLTGRKMRVRDIIRLTPATRTKKKKKRSLSLSLALLLRRLQLPPLLHLVEKKTAEEKFVCRRVQARTQSRRSRSKRNRVISQ